MKKKITMALGVLVILVSIGVIAVSAYRSSESYRQKNAANEIQSIGTPAIPEDAVAMRGKIVGIENGKMIVEPVEGSAELKSSDKYSVPMEHMDASPEPQVGYIVEITYDGSIEETYPAMLGTVYYVKVVVERMSSDCKAFNPEGVKIGIDNCTYICTGMEIPIEPDESIIEYVEIPVGGDSTISAYARINKDNEDYLVCLIGDEWFKFITE